LEKEKGLKGLDRSLRAKLISGCYVGYFLIDALIFSMSSFSMTYILVLGTLCLIAAVGLWSQRKWGLWLAAALSPLTICVGAVTLYAWIGFVGLSLNVYVLMLSIGLLFYSATATILFFYLFANRKLFA